MPPPFPSPDRAELTSIPGASPEAAASDRDFRGWALLAELRDALLVSFGLALAFPSLGAAVGILCGFRREGMFGGLGQAVNGMAIAWLPAVALLVWAFRWWDPYGRSIRSQRFEALARGEAALRLDAPSIRPIPVTMLELLAIPATGFWLLMAGSLLTGR
jgi:hypothetical protein